MPARIAKRVGFRKTRFALHPVATAAVGEVRSFRHGRRSARAELLVENLASAETARTQGPQRRKDVVFETADLTSPFASVLNSQFESARGVAVSDVIVDQSEEELSRATNADKGGYVAYTKINTAEDTVDLMGASRE